MKAGDIVEWTNGIGVVLSGVVLEDPQYDGDRPKVREYRNGTVLRPLNAKVIGSTNPDKVTDAVRLYKALIETDRISTRITQDLFELVNNMTDQERSDYYDKTK